MSYYHKTAMLNKSTNFLNCNPGKIIVDGTIGGFGHANLICNKINPGGTFIGIDKDIDAIINAKNILKRRTIKNYIFHGNFTNLPYFLKKIGIDYVDGIIIDIGISLHQIKMSGRGFSFMKNEPLDMRMNIKEKITAATILANLKEKEIAYLLRKNGEIRWSKKIAHYLVKARNITPITTSKQLSELIEQVIPKKITKKQKIHPATRTFMALRYAVNQELKNLNQFLKTSIHLLKPTGRLCIMSFNSLEDKIVKNRFKFFEHPCICPSDFPICTCKLKPIAKSITKKVIKPSKEEILKNPMARSTRLRVVEKL